MAMVNPFTDLDLLMDHNTSFASSGSMAPSSPPPYPTPPPPPSSSALQLLDPESSSAVVLDSSSLSSSVSSSSFHAFASLRAAFPDTFSDNLRGNGGGGDGRHKSSAGIYAFLLRREGGRRICRAPIRIRVRVRSRN